MQNVCKYQMQMRTNIEQNISSGIVSKFTYMSDRSLLWKHAWASACAQRRITFMCNIRFSKLAKRFLSVCRWASEHVGLIKTYNRSHTRCRVCSPRRASLSVNIWRSLVQFRSTFYDPIRRHVHPPTTIHIHIDRVLGNTRTRPQERATIVHIAYIFMYGFRSVHFRIERK